MKDLGTLQFLRVRQIWMRVSDGKLILLTRGQTLGHCCRVLEYLFLSNCMKVCSMLSLTNCHHGLIGLIVDELLVLGDGWLQRWLRVGNDKLLDHLDWLACFKAFPILRRCSDEVLHVALLARLRRMTMGFEWRRISSGLVFRLRHILTPLSFVRTWDPRDFLAEMRNFSCRNCLAVVLLYVLSVGLLQHVKYKG